MNIRIFISLSFLTIVFQVVTAQTKVEAYSEPFNEIDKFLLGQFPQNEPGGVVLISKGDNVLFKKSYGMANIESREPIQENMIFEIASMTKQFTAVAVLQLTEQHKLSLKDDIRDYKIRNDSFFHGFVVLCLEFL